MVTHQSNNIYSLRSLAYLDLFIATPVNSGTDSDVTLEGESHSANENFVVSPIKGSGGKLFRYVEVDTLPGERPLTPDSVLRQKTVGYISLCSRGRPSQIPRCETRQTYVGFPIHRFQLVLVNNCTADYAQWSFTSVAG